MSHSIACAFGGIQKGFRFKTLTAPLSDRLAVTECEYLSIEELAQSMRYWHSDLLNTPERFQTWYWCIAHSTSTWYRVTQKKGTFEMRSGSHVQLAALRSRDLELQTTLQFSNHGSVERSTACFRHKNILVLLGFQKFPFFVSSCITRGTNSCTSP